MTDSEGALGLPEGARTSEKDRRAAIAWKCGGDRNDRPQTQHSIDTRIILEDLSLPCRRSNWCQHSLILRGLIQNVGIALPKHPIMLEKRQGLAAPSSGAHWSAEAGSQSS
jgi:hypothetical protein